MGWRGNANGWFCSWYPEKRVQSEGDVWTPAGSQDKTSRWDGGLGGSFGLCYLSQPQQTPTIRSSLQCSRTVSVFFCGFAVVYFCINLFRSIHRHIWALKGWVTVLWQAKEVSLALKSSVRLSAEGRLSNQAVFWKGLNQEYTCVTLWGKQFHTSMSHTV